MIHFRAAVGLGSNIGNRQAHIQRALDRLRLLAVDGQLLAAPIRATEPLKVGEHDPGGEYLNTAATLAVTLEPEALLAALHGIERQLGRDRVAQPHGAPRTIDLDLLLFDDRIIASPNLSVPHPGLTSRRFVLEPLAAIAPHWRVPTAGVDQARWPTVVEVFNALAAR